MPKMSFPVLPTSPIIVNIAPEPIKSPAQNKYHCFWFVALPLPLAELRYLLVERTATIKRVVKERKTNRDTIATFLVIPTPIVTRGRGSKRRPMRTITAERSKGSTRIHQEEKPSKTTIFVSSIIAKRRTARIA
jgi:hypothetical protein